MTEESSVEKKPRGRRPAASLAERIAEAERNLATLREQQRQEQKESVEKNRKAILDLFRSERLDLIPVEEFRKVMPRLRALLGVEASSASSAGASGSGHDGATKRAKAA